MWSKCYVKTFVIMWYEMLSSWTKCYHLEFTFSCGMKWYHLGWNVIIWDEMLSSGMKCYHLEQMLSCATKVILWKKMLSFGQFCDEKFPTNNVIIWCCHVMLSCAMITPLFYYSWKLQSLKNILVFLNNNMQVTISYVLYVFYLLELFFLISEWCWFTE